MVACNLNMKVWDRYIGMLLGYTERDIELST